MQGDRKDFKIHDALTVKLHFSILFYARHRVKSGMSAPVVLQVLRSLNTSELIFTQPVFLRSRVMSGYEGILSFCRLDFLFITKASRFKPFSGNIVHTVPVQPSLRLHQADVHFLSSVSWSHDFR